MSTQEEIEVGIRAVIEEVEAKVSDCCVGPARAFFEIPVGEKHGGYVRGIYRMYVCSGPTVRDVLSMIRDALNDQIKAATSRSMTTFLFWRLEDKIQVEQTEGDGLWRARSRFTVLPEENMS